MGKPSVSVIMAEYNTPVDTLIVSIESILSQSLSDFELIIVDDCGFNDVESIISVYEDDRIKVLKNKENMGLVYSLNRALGAAASNYVARMDTDDIAFPERFERQHDFMERSNLYTVVGSRAMEFSAEGDTGIIGTPGEIGSRELARGDAPIHPSVMMLRDTVLLLGGYPNYRRAEDFALWCEVLLADNRIHVMEDILLKYRVNREDYAKRGLSKRGGEIKAKLHYFPLLNISPWGYLYIGKSLLAGAAPPVMLRLLKKYKLNLRKLNR